MLRIARLHVGRAVRARTLSTSAQLLSAPASTIPSAHKPVALHADKLAAGIAKEIGDAPSGTFNADAPLAHIPLPDLFSLRGRTVLITGGGRGVGLTLARAVLEAGAHVRALDVLPAPTEPEWSAATTLAAEKGLSLEYTTLDVTREPDVHAVVKDAFASAPTDAPVRGLFHAAAVILAEPALNNTAEQLRTVLDVNLTGSFLVAQAFAREFAARMTRGGASIVLVGSIAGHVANQGVTSAVYNASKAGVIQLARNLAMEWGPLGIRVNSLSPGYIRTFQTAMQLAEKPDLEKVWLQGSLLGRLSTTDEYRGPAVYLLSDASSFMTGADMLVDGGHTTT